MWALPLSKRITDISSRKSYILQPSSITLVKRYHYLRDQKRIPVEKKNC